MLKNSPINHYLFQKNKNETIHFKIFVMLVMVICSPQDAFFRALNNRIETEIIWKWPGILHVPVKWLMFIFGTKQKDYR